MASDEFGNPGLYREKAKDQEDNRKENNNNSEEKNHPSCFQNLKHYLWEFCSRTTVHGFTYLGERGRTIPERIWWSITILIALYLCISLIIQTYEKWLNSPVIVTFATTQTAIWKIPFPAVTICAEVKMRKRRFNYTDVYLKKRRNEKLTEQEIREFEYMSMVCDTPQDMLNENLTTTDERAVDFLMEVSPNYTQTMFRVQWHGREYKDLTKLFSPILTSEGLCYTFNLVDRADLFTDIVSNYKDCFSTNGKSTKWSIENGYDDDAGLNAYPKRSLVAALKGGLNIMFKVPNVDLDYACRDTMQGFKVILHHPAEVPRGRQKYFRVPLDYSVTAAIQPNMMRTSEALEAYKPKHRKCYFSKERNLKYFKIYNQANCLNECLIDYSYRKCGCVGFYMQREASTPICSASKLKCLVDARSTYLTNEIKSKINKYKKQLAESSQEEKCRCLPACNSLEFNVETSQAAWKLHEFLEIERQAGILFPEDPDYPLNESHFSRLAMYYKDMQFITSERNELYGAVDFLAACGGLLGLFTGFSFISALEILYYLTLRYICNLQKFGRHYWSGSEELLKNKTDNEDENKVV